MACKTGDRLLAVNGVPYRGEATLYSASTMPASASQSSLRWNRREQYAPFALPVTLAHASFWEKVANAILNFLLPALCLLLGFWVVAVRPHDFLAWLLLALMMTIPQLFENYLVQGWPAGWREVAMVYHSSLGLHVYHHHVLFRRAIFLNHFLRSASGTRSGKLCSGSWCPLLQCYKVWRSLFRWVNWTTTRR